MASQSSDASLNESIDENPSFLDMELEALQSIFINELEVKENEKYTTISIDLYPSTADKLDEQYVRMTLEFILSEEYPESIPDIKIRNPRGLSDEELNSIVHDLCSIAESKKGSSMLFEMIDAAKEHLTVGNRPCGECAICLHGFSDNDIFTKTECYHYFHSHCLARYAKNFFENSSISEDDAENKSKSEELLCPMCRIPIEFDEWDVDYPPPEESEESSFKLSEDMIQLQKKMATLFQKQVKKGGIIDVEAEKNKYLLEISNVPTRLNNEERSEQKLTAEGDSVTDSKSHQSEDLGSPTCDVKDAKDRSKNFDHRGRNRNFNRLNENRGYNRYGQRYNNKQTFNRGNYNKYGYGKQNFRNSYQDEVQNVQHHTKDSSTFQDIAKSEDLVLNSSPDVVETDDASEISEYPSPGSKPKYNPNFSPRYKNRGYHHGRNNYNYDSSRRSDKFSYDRRNSQPSHRYSVQRAEESSGKSEKKVENDFPVNDDNYKSDYRSGNYKHDNGYYSKQRYSDNRNNSHRGFKGAYSGRDGYGNSYNSRSNRYTDSKDREQYSERNYREKYTDSREQYSERNYREKYTDSKDREQYSERNYREKYTDSKDREQYSERNYRGKYTDSKDRDQYSERNYREKYADSKDREQYSERNYREKYTDSKDREQYSDRNYREKYTDSKDREQYSEKNYREKRTYRDMKYKNNDDTAYNYRDMKYKNNDDAAYNYRDMKYKNNDGTAYNYRDMKYKNNDDTAYNKSRQSSRNYTGNRFERHSDKSCSEPSNNESKELELNNENQNGDHDTLPAENGSSDPQHNSSSPKEKSLHKKDVTDSEEKSSNIVSAFNSSSSNSFPNAFSENSDITPRTVNPPPGFANPLKKVVYGLQGANPPPGFNKS